MPTARTPFGNKRILFLTGFEGGRVAKRPRQKRKIRAVLRHIGISHFSAAAPAPAFIDDGAVRVREVS